MRGEKCIITARGRRFLLAGVQICILVFCHGGNNQAAEALRAWVCRYSLQRLQRRQRQEPSRHGSSVATSRWSAVKVLMWHRGPHARAATPTLSTLLHSRPCSPYIPISTSSPSCSDQGFPVLKIMRGGLTAILIVLNRAFYFFIMLFFFFFFSGATWDFHHEQINFDGLIKVLSRDAMKGNQHNQQREWTSSDQRRHHVSAPHRVCERADRPTLSLSFLGCGWKTGAWNIS